MKPRVVVKLNLSTRRHGNCSIAEKLDGNRLVFNTETMQGQSRNGKSMNLPNVIVKYMKQLPPGIYDGELVSKSGHSYLCLPNIRSKSFNLDTTDFVYQIFDMYMSDTTWKERRDMLESYFINVEAQPYVRLIPILDSLPWSQVNLNWINKTIPELSSINNTTCEGLVFYDHDSDKMYKYKKFYLAIGEILKVERTKTSDGYGIGAAHVRLLINDTTKFLYNIARCIEPFSHKTKFTFANDPNIDIIDNKIIESSGKIRGVMDPKLMKLTLNDWIDPPESELTNFERMVNAPGMESIIVNVATGFMSKSLSSKSQVDKMMDTLLHDTHYLLISYNGKYETAPKLLFPSGLYVIHINND